MEVVFCHPDIRHFLDILDDSTASKVARLIDLLSVRAYHLSMPYSKKLEKDLYELRAQNLQNVRVFYTFYDGRVFLLHAIYKKSQKLRKKDVETARKRLARLRTV